MKKIIITIGIVVVSFVGLLLLLSNNKAKNEAQTAAVADKIIFR